MSTYRVIFSPEAEEDLRVLMRHIATDSPSAGLTFTELIRSYCKNLDLFPKRWADRSDIGPNVRTVGFDK